MRLIESVAVSVNCRASRKPGQGHLRVHVLLSWLACDLFLMPHHAAPGRVGIKAIGEPKGPHQYAAWSAPPGPHESCTM
jgi:hypothetical protein